MERLQKVMAHAGIASRRKSEEIIADGRVKVNGETVTEMGKKVSPRDVIEVDGKPIYEEELVYFLLNKPENTISSVSDEKNRQTVIDLFPTVTERIYPVGRLDYDTTGALVLTNDGELANLLMHPRYEMKKTYIATVEGDISKESLQQLESGVLIDGGFTAPAEAKKLSFDRNEHTSQVELMIHEGRYHQVKKMLAAVGHPVLKLHRSKYSFLSVEGLPIGQYRTLELSEIEKLKTLAKT